MPKAMSRSEEIKAIRAKHGKLPEPVEHDSRICFGISYFASEADAQKYAAYVRDMGLTYNGGWFDGMPCGRNKTFDRTKDGIKLYAVTE